MFKAPQTVYMHQSTIEHFSEYPEIECFRQDRGEEDNTYPVIDTDPPYSMSDDSSASSLPLEESVIISDEPEITDDTSEENTISEEV